MELDNLFNMEAKAPKQPTPVAAVNPRADIFAPDQIGTRDNPAQFEVKDHMTVERYEVNGAVALRMFSYGEPIAQAATNNSIEVLTGRHMTETSKRHVTVFIEAVTGVKLPYAKLIEKYGKSTLSPINVRPTVFPRVTVGMINKAIKATQKATGYDGQSEFKVDSKTLDIIEIHIPSGNVQTWYNGNTSLREVLHILINRGWLDYRFILEANKPENIRKYYRG